MDTILDDLSPESGALALDANKIAFGKLIAKRSRGIWHQKQGLLWYQTGIACGQFNGVLQTNLDPAILPVAVESVLAGFKAQALAFHWHVGPSSSADLGAVLESHGISFEETEPGMALDLHALKEDVLLASELKIVAVSSPEMLRQWVWTWGSNATPQAIIDCWYTLYAALLFGKDDDNGVRLYLGTIDGVPVATVELFFAAGVAAINHVVTLHEFRRQGIGAAMTLWAAREARAAGYRIAVLTASPFGIEIYRRLGFQECCQVSTYAWEPE